MSGFLAAYSGTRRVIIGDLSRGYWVELREHLSQGDKEVAERALTSGKVVGGNVEMELDVARYRQLMVLASIADWNLDDTNGTVWPINVQNVRRLPGDEFDRLWKLVDELNAPASSEERRQFHVEGDVSDQDGYSGAGEPRRILVAESAMEARRHEFDRVADSSLA